jgi:Ice-binding-like
VARSRRSVINNRDLKLFQKEILMKSFTGKKAYLVSALIMSVFISSMSAYGSPQPKGGNLAAVDLGVAGDFVILSKSGITDVPTSDITGDIGTSPITGAAIGVSCPEVAGTIYEVDATGPACAVTAATRLTTAVLDMETAYTDAAGRSNPNFLNSGAGELGGLTLTPGLYKFTTAVTISTDVTLKGGPNAVFIFQIPGTLTMSSAVVITLSGGVQAKNVFWQVAEGVTLGTTSHFEGIILGQTLIALQTGASINGRTLAQTAVTLDQNTVTQPSQNRAKGHNK